MEGFLLLAGLVLGVACLIVGKLQHQGGSAGDAAHGGDDGHLTDSVDIFPVGLGRFGSRRCRGLSMLSAVQLLSLSVLYCFLILA